MPKFAANLTMLFTEYPMVDRIGHAARAGFRGVEILLPYDEDIDGIQAGLERNGLELINFNLPLGNMAAGDRGFANDPRRTTEFEAGVERAVGLAERLGVKRVNCIAGKMLPDVAVSEQWDTLRQNLGFAAARTAERGIVQLVEPLNTIDNPGYIICSPHRAFSLVEEVGHPNLKVEYDLYHAQKMEGNLATTIRDHIGQIGHVQIADNPGRHEPGTGEINFPFMFQVLDDAGYDGWVSLEYNPSGRTEDSFGWMRGV
ncbi:MAG: TIM barrel protein [Thermomicrobiales bacterium]|nr:TIM barrel protein [Thermomicrobiales bacterium]